MRLPTCPRGRVRARLAREIPNGGCPVSVSITQYKNFVGGEWVDAASGETMEVLNPATGEVIAEVPRGSTPRTSSGRSTPRAKALRRVARRRRRRTGWSCCSSSPT